MPKPSSKKTPSPAESPVLVCPFTGGKIELVCVGDGLLWQGRGAFWYTKLYGTREELEYDISTRAGVEPAFDRVLKITVTEREPPAANPVQGEIEACKKIDEQVDEFMSKK